jgi:phosphoribosylaminoimidazole-succinocarboxamide synthase
MTNAIVKTDFHFPKQKNRYVGKVRDVYNINDQFMVMVVTDRISAFDVVLPKGIPYKGQVLNQIASEFLDKTADICPNWKINTPDPMVTIGHFCEPFPVEMIIRASGFQNKRTSGISRVHDHHGKYAALYPMA